MNRSRLRRGVIIAVSLSAASLTVISLATLDRETFRALSDLSPAFLCLAAVLSLGKWVWMVIRMRLLVNSLGGEVPTRNIVKTVYAGYFTGLVTPWRAGGVTGEAVFLYEYGMAAGESVAAVSFGACISTILLMLFFPFAIWISSTRIELNLSIRGFLFSALAAGILYLALVLWAVLRPQATVGKTLLNHSPAFLRKRRGYQLFLERLSSEIRTFALSLRRLMRLDKVRLSAVVFLTVLYWGTGFFAVPVAAIGLGYGSYFWKVVMAQMVIQILMPFVPTPGGSGVGEAGFLFVYRSALPSAGAAGLITLIWRFLDFYLGLIVGGTAFLLAMRDITRARRHVVRVEESEETGTEKGCADSLPS